MKTEKFFGVIAAAILCPLSASAIEFTLTDDSDIRLAGSFQSQFALSDTGRGRDSGSFSSTYWDGGLSFLCSPDMPNYTSFVPFFNVHHTEAGSGPGVAMSGNTESIAKVFGSFSFQPYSVIDPKNDWFVVRGSFSKTDNLVSVSGTFEVTRKIATVPDSGATLTLAGMAIGVILLAKTCLSATTASPSRR